MREEVIKKVIDKKVIVIVRGVYGEECLRLAEALYKGGVELMEVTFNQFVKDEQKKTTDTISLLNREMRGRISVGAGTVTSREMLEQAGAAGAKFIVSPNVDADIIGETVKKDMVSMPGAMTPTEIFDAYNYGADFVKVFPAGSLGADYIRSVRSPLNNIPLLAVGGVNENNINDYIKAGACGVGVGGNLVNKKWISAGMFDKITGLAEKFINNIN